MGIKDFLKDKFVMLKDAIFPENYTCIICNAELKIDNKYCMCDDCLKKIEFINDKACEKCGAKVLADSTLCSDCKKDGEHITAKNYSCLVFDGDIKKVIYDFKYGNKRFLKNPLGRILYDKYLKMKEEYKPDVIVAVPLHKIRRGERGYNQSELMLKTFATDKEIMDFDNLIRVRNTPNQASMKKEDRRINVQNAFEVVNKDAFKDKRVLIVDDVYTSGATIDECAKVLYISGAYEVRSMTLANSHVELPIERKEKYIKSK